MDAQGLASELKLAADVEGAARRSAICAIAAGEDAAAIADPSLDTAMLDALAGFLTDEDPQDPTLRPVAREVAIEFWGRQLVAVPTAAMTWAAARWLTETVGLTSKLTGSSPEDDPDFRDFYSVPANLAWLTRDLPATRAAPVAALLQATTGQVVRSPLGDSTPTDDQALFVLMIGAQRLRFQSRYSDLYELLRGPRAKGSDGDPANPRVRWPDDPMLTALRGLGALGRQHPESLDEGLDAVRAADSSELATGRTRHVCLHALTLAEGAEDQGERIVDLGEKMVKLHGDDPNLYLRLAYGYRKLRSWDEARTALRNATQALQEHHDLSVLRDIARERDLVSASQTLDASLTEARELAADVRRMDQRLEAQLSNTVQILGVLAAVVAFVVADLQILAATDSVTQALLATGVLAATLTGFLLVLNVLVHHDGAQRRQANVTLAMLGVVAGAILLFALDLESPEVNVDVLGYILGGAGVAGLVWNASSAGAVVLRNRR